MAAIRLKLDQTALLVVGLQEKLLPHIHESDRVIEQSAKLLDGAKALGMPVVATEQYRKGLGPTVESIAHRLESLNASIHEKLKFSACIEAVRQDLAAANIAIELEPHPVWKNIGLGMIACSEGDTETGITLANELRKPRNYLLTFFLKIMCRQQRNKKKGLIRLP